MSKDSVYQGKEGSITGLVPKAPSRAAPNLLLQLQQTIGNKAVQSLMGRQQPIQGYFTIDAEHFKEKQVEIGKQTIFSGQDKDTETGSFLKGNKATMITRMAEEAPTLRISDNGKLAMEDTDISGRQAKTFFMDSAKMDESNRMLEEVGSKYRLEQAGGGIKVPDAQGEAVHDLVQTVGAKADGGSKGDQLTGAVLCDGMAEEVSGFGGSKRVKLQGIDQRYEPPLKNESGNRLARYVTSMAKSNDPSEALQDSEYELNQAPLRTVTSYRVRIELNKRNDAQEVGKKLKLGMPQLDVSSEKYGCLNMSTRYYMEPSLKENQYKLLAGSGLRYILQDVETDELEPSNAEKVQALAPQRDQMAADYGQLDSEVLKQTSMQLGVNQYAAPEVGESFVIYSAGSRNPETKQVYDVRSNTPMQTDWSEHWGGVVAQDGEDRITLENYDRHSENKQLGSAYDSSSSGQLVFFNMYGPASKQQSWHELWSEKGPFPNPVSAVYKKTGKPQEQQ